MYRFWSNKALYPASLLFVMFIGPAVVPGWVLQNGFCPSFPVSGYFLGIGSIVFSKFWDGARNPNNIVHDRTIFLEKLLLLQTRGKRDKIGPKIELFFNLLKTLVFNFYRIGSIMKIYFICFVSVLNLYMLKILFLRHCSKCYLPIKLQ